jgi:hypothetical protein
MQQILPGAGFARHGAVGFFFVCGFLRHTGRSLQRLYG